MSACPGPIPRLDDRGISDSARLHRYLKIVFEFEGKTIYFGIGNPVHRTVQAVGLKGEFYKVVVGKKSALVKILGRAFDVIGPGPSPTRDQVHNALVEIAFVVVDMPRADDKARVAILHNLREIVSQGNFVRPWVVVDLDVLLKIGHRRMVTRRG